MIEKCGRAVINLPDAGRIYAVLGKFKSLEVLTKWAFQAYREQFPNAYLNSLDIPNSEEFVKHKSSVLRAITNQNQRELGQLLHNDFEKIIFPKYPQVQRLKQVFEAQDVLGVTMTGSGISIF